MQFSSITVVLFFAYYIFNSTELEYERRKLKDKYDYNPSHYGFFADRKLYKMLNEKDLSEWKIKARRFNKIQVSFLVYAVLIFMISGIFFGGKL